MLVGSEDLVSCHKYPVIAGWLRAFSTMSFHGCVCVQVSQRIHANSACTPNVLWFLTTWSARIICEQKLRVILICPYMLCGIWVALPWVSCWVVFGFVLKKHSLSPDPSYYSGLFHSQNFSKPKQLSNSAPGARLLASFHPLALAALVSLWLMFWYVLGLMGLLGERE